MLVEGKEVVVSGNFPSIVRLKDEYYVWIDNPEDFLLQFKNKGLKADLFTFLLKVGVDNNFYNYHAETDSLSVLPITTYDNWWTEQINDKTRNMIRRAYKKGVEIKTVAFDDDLIKGIKSIYDESPYRQGKPFKHYNKDLETLKKDHISFLEQSQFVGAFYKDELIGYIKLVHGDGISHLMQIISKLNHRNKAPTNALLAKAVEICAQKNVPYLHYGIWSRGGLGTFKINHAFERYDLTRYYLPLNMKGKIILKLNLHHGIKERLPEGLLVLLIKFREKWYRDSSK